jgi:hypothetical protein
MLEPDPKGKLMIDAVLDSKQQRRDRRGWTFWITVLGMSLAAGCAYRIESLPYFFRIALAVLGAIGAILFLAFLSSKPLGRDFYNGPEW